jgi:sugar phosphate isomerase/epimerase
MKPVPGLSSWSLNRTLGAPQFDAIDGKVQREAAEGALTLTEVPAQMAQRGLKRLEICHFHLSSTNPTYVAELRSALDAAGVELWTVLIDGGDITHPETGEADVEWTKRWIDVAGELGARHARVIAGKAQPTPENLQLSRDRIKVLCEHAKPLGVRLFIENWFDLLPSPREVLWLLDELDGELGLNIDFGNWSGDDKYEKLEAIAPRAESSHSKARFTAPGEMDKADFVRCLEITQRAGFAGSHTLIYDGADPDEWRHIEIERDVVAPYLA